MSLRTRKIILWSVMIIVTAGLLFWWINNSQKIAAEFPGKQWLEGLNLPKFEMPELPGFSGEELEELEKAIEENGQ